jgi:hypothetical protein
MLLVFAYILGIMPALVIGYLFTNWTRAYFHKTQSPKPRKMLEADKCYKLVECNFLDKMH